MMHFHCQSKWHHSLPNPQPKTKWLVLCTPLASKIFTTDSLPLQMQTKLCHVMRRVLSRQVTVTACIFSTHHISSSWLHDRDQFFRHVFCHAFAFGISVWSHWRWKNSFQKFCISLMKKKFYMNVRIFLLKSAVCRQQLRQMATNATVHFPFYHQTETNCKKREELRI